jgi:aspartyl-tRNA(Asn)/glutamyl-tRNA(Gln) amidotransferase subunit C
MAVTEQDVRHIAALARLGLEAERVPSLVAELNGILAHMEELGQADTSGVTAAVSVGSGGMPLRLDAGLPYPLAARQEAFAPAVVEGFFVVPRLSTHEDPAAAPGGARADAEGSDADEEGRDALSDNLLGGEDE